jgi:hypothetical protein
MMKTSVPVVDSTPKLFSFQPICRHRAGSNLCQLPRHQNVLSLLSDNRSFAPRVPESCAELSSGLRKVLRHRQILRSISNSVDPSYLASHSLTENGLFAPTISMLGAPLNGATPPTKLVEHGRGVVRGVPGWGSNRFTSEGVPNQGMPFLLAARLLPSA